MCVGGEDDIDPQSQRADPAQESADTDLLSPTEDLDGYLAT